MTAPAGRILTLAIAPNGGPVQNGLDPPAQPPGCFRLLRPDPFKNTHHQSGINALDGERSEDRIGIGGQRVSPLVSVLGVLPARSVGPDVSVGTFLEGTRLGRVQPRGCPGRLPLLYGVDTLPAELSRFQGLPAGF